MNLIIRNAKIIDSKSPFHNKTVDILIVDGLIKKIGTSLPSLEHTDEIQLDNLHVSQGWFDSSFRWENPVLKIESCKRTSGCCKSGFTAIALQLIHSQ
jgi:dihydroorotase